MSLRRSLSTLFVLVPLFVAGAAHAQNDAAAAEALFDDAKRLMTLGHYADACPKLEQSLRLDAGIGTKFQLANCWQHLGRTASAWKEFNEVAADAKASSQSARERVARERAAALEPLLSKLNVDVKAAQSTAGLAVKRDGVEIPRAEWGAPVPVDPGEHVVVATAPGKKPWQMTVNTSGSVGKVLSVEVPMLLDDRPVAAPVATAPPPREPTVVAAQSLPPPAIFAPPPIAIERRNGDAQRVVGGIAMGLGAAGLATGVVFGVESLSKHDDAAHHCIGNLCDATGVATRDDAMRAGNASTVAFIAGGVVLASGIVIYLTAPPRAPRTEVVARSVRVAPMLGGGTTGMSLGGAF